ncbi:PEPD, partial [Symbiodinium sp. CCMP2456]
VLLFAGGGDPLRHDTDHEDVFRQESTFHYLFGVREPGFMGCLDLESGAATLFAPRLPPEYELWMGSLLSGECKISGCEEMKEHYGVEEVVYMDQIAEWFKSRAPSKVYLQRGVNSDSGNEVAPAKFEGLDAYEVDTAALH